MGRLGSTRRTSARPTNQLEVFAGVSEQVHKGDPANIMFLDFQKPLTTLFCQGLLTKELNSNGRRRKVLL